MYKAVIIWEKENLEMPHWKKQNRLANQVRYGVYVAMLNILTRITTALKARCFMQLARYRIVINV